MPKTLAQSMYVEQILDLYKHPLNFGIIVNPTYEAEKYNPQCGDRVKIYLLMDDNIVKMVKFTGTGCAISMAATSLLTENISNKDNEYLKNLTNKDILNLLEIPISLARLDCALLSLGALKEAVNIKK